MILAWPWIMLAGLGAFHGLNPAMGWLFAVALGLHRDSRATVATAIVPIAIGHFLSVALVVAAFLATGFVIAPRTLAHLAGGILIVWAVYYAVWGHRHRVRFGMQVSFIGLGAWSFLMATAHGAGLMLIPALMPICFASPEMALHPASAAVGAVLVHSAAMLLTTALVALVVYEWLGIGILRSTWINLDLVWTLALAASGAFLLFA